MRKLITGASIILIFITLYGLLKTVFEARQVKLSSTTAVATTPTPSPNLLVASTTPTADATSESSPTPKPVSTFTPAPLKIRVVKHQPDQFRKDAISKEELSAIKKAIKITPWSLNSDPKAAANEDYAAIVLECEKAGVHDLLKDLITEALSNEYEPNNEAANGVYATQLNSDFENGDQSDSTNGKSTVEKAAGQETSVDSGSTPTVDQPDVQATTTSSSSAWQSASAEVIRSKIGHVRHRSTVRHRIVDVKMRLIALWHQSLAPTEKSTK